MEICPKAKKKERLYDPGICVKKRFLVGAEAGAAAFESFRDDIRDFMVTSSESLPPALVKACFTLSSTTGAGSGVLGVDVGLNALTSRLNFVFGGTELFYSVELS